MTYPTFWNATEPKTCLDYHYYLTCLVYRRGTCCSLRIYLMLSKKKRIYLMYKKTISNCSRADTETYLWKYKN
jgi:hypothetical protein